MKIKTYAYAVDWARVGKSCRRIIWHQELEAGGTFQCEEDVEQIKNKVVDILKTYASGACEWDYAATESCEPDAHGHWRNVCKDIEVNAFAPCECKKGNMVRVRAFEDWNSWLKAI